MGPERARYERVAEHLAGIAALITFLIAPACSEKLCHRLRNRYSVLLGFRAAPQINDRIKQSTQRAICFARCTHSSEANGIYRGADDGYCRYSGFSRNIAALDCERSGRDRAVSSIPVRHCGEA